MSKLQWTAMLLALVLTIPGCSGTETEQPEDSGELTTDTLPPEPAPLGQPGEAPAAEADGPLDAPPAEGPIEGPDADAKKPGGGVAGAIGRALLKGITGGSAADDRGEAPPYEP
jgi:hypothetical protein